MRTPRCWHITRSERMSLDAARSHKRAAEWAGITNATEGLRHWERVRSLVRTLPQTSETSQLGASACLGTLGVGWRLGTPTAEAAGIFDEGRRLAEESGDLRTLAALTVSMRVCSAWWAVPRTSTCATAARQRNWPSRPTIKVCSSPNAVSGFRLLFAGCLVEGIEACDRPSSAYPRNPRSARSSPVIARSLVS